MEGGRRRAEGGGKTRKLLERFATELGYYFTYKEVNDKNPGSEALARVTALIQDVADHIDWKYSEKDTPEETFRARRLFAEGLPLIGKVGRDLALDLDLFSRGGLEILRSIESQDYDVLSARPAISSGTKLGLMLRAVGGKLLPFLGLGRLGNSQGKAA